MAVASPIDVAVNPNNTAQRLILWGNGRIDPVGGAVPVTEQANWYSRIDQPVAVALHITNWATSAGYILTANGSIHEFNGAPDIGNGIISGVPYLPHEKRYIDWKWNTSGNGQGYILDVYGQLWPFGGASAPTRSGPRWTWAAARKLKMQFTPSVRAITMDIWGGLHGDFSQGNVIAPGGYWRGLDYSRDFVVTAWATTPSGYQLDLFGGVHEFGSATDTHGYPYRSGADVARLLYVVSAVDPIQMGEVWSGGQQYEWVSSTPPTVSAGAGTTEVQRVTVTGSPTGGSFTLTFSGQTTAAIVFNATASAVQTALRALSNIGSTGVTVTGLGTTASPYVVTFAGPLALTDVAQMTATSSLTGGTSPAVTVTTFTQGVTASPPLTVTGTTRPMLSWIYSDPQNDSQTAWELYVFTQAFATGHTMTDPAVWASSALVASSGINEATRGIASPVDLANGAYRMYVRAEDSAGQWSAWSNYGWTQNVPLPTTPTGLTATANQAAYTVALSVSATTGGTANLVLFECSDDAGVTWVPVRGAAAVTLVATTTATDYDPPLGVARIYRATAYAVDPAVASAPSATATATITALAYVVTAVDNPALGGRLAVQEPVEWTRRVNAGVFDGLDADYPTVVKDGGKPRGRRSTVQIFTETKAAWDVVENLAMSRSTLVYRDPFGGVRYCEVVGDWSATLFPGAATRHMHTTDLPLVEVKPPQLGT